VPIPQVATGRTGGQTVDGSAALSDLALTDAHSDHGLIRPGADAQVERVPGRLTNHWQAAAIRLLEARLQQHTLAAHGEGELTLQVARRIPGARPLAHRCREVDHAGDTLVLVLALSLSLPLVLPLAWSLSVGLRLRIILRGSSPRPEAKRGEDAPGRQAAQCAAPGRGAAD
jgi:hypothetical protein